jgi:hypothetical protein
MKTGVGFRHPEIGWANCWASECPETAIKLLEFPRQEAFRFVWYCDKHAKEMRKEHPTSRVRRSLINDGNGRLVERTNQPIRIKKEKPE